MNESEQLKEQKNYDPQTKTLRLSLESNKELTEKVVSILVNTQGETIKITPQLEDRVVQEVFTLMVETFNLKTLADMKEQLTRVLVRIDVDRKLETKMLKPGWMRDKVPTQWLNELHGHYWFRNAGDYTYILRHAQRFKLAPHHSSSIWEICYLWGLYTPHQLSKKLFELEY